jgi:Domain of unknown function (DUF4157)
MKAFDDERLAKRRPRPSTATQVAREHTGIDLDRNGAVDRPLEARQILSLQRSAGNAAVAQLLADDDRESLVQDVVGKGGGEPLPASVRTGMEARFGEDFSDVRIHTGAEAAASAKSVQAQAYTVGDEIVFGSESAPVDSPAGQRGLAHELAHVVQQRSGPVEGTPAPGGISISDPSDRFEIQAEHVADAMDGRAADNGDAGAGAVSVQRQDDEVDDEMDQEEIPAS